MRLATIGGNRVVSSYWTRSSTQSPTNLTY